MKYIIGVIGIVAAVIIVICSAYTLFWTAYNSASEPWQQWLQGIQVAAIVAFEAGALLLIGYCFYMRWYTVAIGGSALLICAMAYTSTQEMQLHVGTQTNMTEKRKFEVSKLERVKGELSKAFERRDRLENQIADLSSATAAEATRGGCGAKCDALLAHVGQLRADLDGTKTRIAQLEKQWDTQVVNLHAEAVPGASWAGRVFGGSEQAWQDAVPAIKLAFWMLARVFAVPLAVIGWLALRLHHAEQPSTAPKRKRDTEPEADPKPPVSAKPEPQEKAPELALQHRPVVQAAIPLKVREDPHRKIAFSKDDLAQFPKLVSSKNVPTKAQNPRPSNEKKREGCVIDWIQDCASTTPDKSAKVASGEAYKESYLQWCRLRNLHPIGQSKFTRKLVAQFKVKERKRDAVTGTRYIPGLLLHKPQIEMERKVA